MTGRDDVEKDVELIGTRVYTMIDPERVLQCVRLDYLGGLYEEGKTFRQ